MVIEEKAVNRGGAVYQSISAALSLDGRYGAIVAVLI